MCNVVMFYFLLLCLYNVLMPETLGYMITWTTYGSWLQGDKRGFVKKGRIMPENKALADINIQGLVKNPVRLSKTHRQVAANAIIEEAKRLNQTIYALSVSSSHIHLVAEYTPMPIGTAVTHYKNAAQVALRKIGLLGRIWTKGFDKRYCFNEESLRRRINYVNSHNQR